MDMIPYPKWFQSIKETSEREYQGCAPIDSDSYLETILISKIHKDLVFVKAIPYDPEVIALTILLLNNYKLLAREIEDIPASNIRSIHYLAVNALHRNKMKLNANSETTANICATLSGKLYTSTPLSISMSIISWCGLGEYTNRIYKLAEVLSCSPKLNQVYSWRIAIGMVVHCCIGAKDLPSWLDRENYTQELAFIKYILLDVEEKYNEDEIFNVHISFAATKLKSEMSYVKPNNMSDPPSVLSKGLVSIQEHEMGTKLGKGGFGNVYKVNIDNTIYAVKEHKSGNKLNTEAGIREIAVMCSLKHPNIEHITNFSFNTSDFSLLTYMEYADSDLKHLIYPLGYSEKYNKYWEHIWVRNGSYKEPEIHPTNIIKYTTHILRGLSFLHNNGVIHGDIKPGNLLIHNDILRISDFGLSYLGAPSKYASITISSRTGTAIYRDYNLIDELLAGNESVLCNSGIDIWSTAMVIMEMMKSCLPCGMPDSYEELINRMHIVFGTKTSPKYNWAPETFIGRMLIGMVDYNYFRRYTADQCLALLDENYRVPK